MNKAWLPIGTHHGLHISHRPTGRGGTYVPGGWKGIIHSTEGHGVQAMSDVLVAKRAEPHLLIGRDGSHFHVVQFIPLTESSRALEHPPGTLDTNNAHCVQIEVADYAINRATRQDWDGDTYDALTILCLMIENRIPIPRKRPRAFASTPNRYTQRGFIRASGWMGHEHVPSQLAGHWDPGAFNGNRLIREMNGDKYQVKPRR